MSRRAKTEVRQAQIVDAALSLLAETSLEGLSTRAVARAVGLTQPALFRHFRNREALLLAVVRHARERLAERVAAVLSEPGDAPTRLERLVRALLAHVEANPGLPRLLFADAAAGKAASAPLGAALHHLVSMQRTLVAELVRDGQRGGTLADAVDPADAACVLVGAVQGLVLQWELGARADSLSAKASPVTRLWLTGVSPRRERALHAAEDDASEMPAPAAPAPARPSVAPALSLLDVRPTLDTGRDPLDEILARVEAAGPTAWTCVVAPFAPRPLVTLLTSRGFRVSLRRLGGDAQTEPSAETWAVEIAGPQAPPLLSLEALEPPEPLQRVLEAAADLAPGEATVARLPREPHLLYPRLRERGLRWATVLLPVRGEALVRVERPRAPATPSATGGQA